MGASPTGGTTVPIAQLVLEHKIFNLGVLGSNPNGNTKYSLSSVGQSINTGISPLSYTQ